MTDKSKPAPAAAAAPAKEEAFKQRVDVVHDDEGNCWVRVAIPRRTRALCTHCKKYRANCAFLIAPADREHGYTHACRACRKKYELDTPFADIDNDTPGTPAGEA